LRYLLAILCVLSAVIAQVLVKHAAFKDVFSRKWIVLIILSLASYGFSFLFQSYVFRLFPLSRIGPSAAIAIMVLIFGCGVILFGETIQVRQIVGIIMGILSIYLIMT
jgi:drug/metabolite transporter (DMT)-like permease